MQGAAHPAFSSLTIKPVGDFLPVGIYFDDRAQARSDLVDGLNPFEMHLGKPPDAELAAVQAPAEVGYRGVG